MSASASATCTVTGTAGAGVTLTSKVFSNVSFFSFDVVKNLFVMVDNAGKVMRVAIDSATTVTVTLSGAGGNYTVTIS